MSWGWGPQAVGKKAAQTQAQTGTKCFRTRQTGEEGDRRIEIEDSQNSMAGTANQRPFFPSVEPRKQPNSGAFKAAAALTLHQVILWFSL
jgi:hypothetical protein